jgi:hypothetical protein
MISVCERIQMLFDAAGLYESYVYVHFLFRKNNPTNDYKFRCNFLFLRPITTEPEILD